MESTPLHNDVSGVAKGLLKIARATKGGIVGFFWGNENHRARQEDVIISRSATVL
jgi:hypothetical protein